MRVILGLFSLGLLFLMKREKRGDTRDNRYFPVQSDSERIAGHPIVGVS